MSKASTSVAPTPAAEPHGERSHAEIMVIMSALMLSMLLAALDQTIVSTALPKIASEFNSLNKMSWVATSYLITSAIVTPIYGKLGDLFGRKKIFQTSIVIFLLGSVLCGLSQNMNELIFFRGLQGIGGGGLMSLVLAIIGDIVPPRQRGRYQGYFGAVFGISSVLGPVLGGFLASAPVLLGVSGWRWIFYINLPLGMLALSAVAARLHLPVHRRQHKIDYLGVGLLTASVTSLILATTWASDYGWGADRIVALFISTAVFGALFTIWETKASEPLIPLRLFKNDIFVSSTLLAFIVGIAMFASILYIPLYQQIVRGNSPTESGLLMLPLVFGMFSASLTSGRLISKTGHYRIFPISGTLVLTLGVWLFSHLGLTTNHVLLSLWMFVIGLGLGQLMQVPTLAVQNSADRADLGTATSTVTFFRSIGSAVGGAVFGTILTSRLTHHIHELLPNAGSAAAKAIDSGTSQLANVAPQVKHLILTAYVRSFHEMFLIAIPVGLAAFIVALTLRETPLRSSTKAYAEGENLERHHGEATPLVSE